MAAHGQHLLGGIRIATLPGAGAMAKQGLGMADPRANSEQDNTAALRSESLQACRGALAPVAHMAHLARSLVRQVLRKLAYLRRESSRVGAKTQKRSTGHRLGLPAPCEKQRMHLARFCAADTQNA